MLIGIDPEAKLAAATRNLQQCLVDEGLRLADSAHRQQALSVLYRAYGLRPNASAILQSIAAIYEQTGDTESAMCCRRGVVPEHAEKRYFNADKTKKTIIPARKASKCQHIKTHLPESIHLATPQSNALASDKPEFRASRTESRGSFVTKIKNAEYWFDGYNTVIRDSHEKILLEHVKGSPFVIADSARQRPEQYLEGNVCFLETRSSSIYYHWMLDLLPKFSVLQASGVRLDSIDYFVVRVKSDFQRETLQHLGIEASKLIEPWGDGFTKCENLYIPFIKHDRGDRFYNGLGLGMARWVPEWLKSTFLEKPINDKLKNTKLYISRAKRGTRSPADENHLIRLLEQRGFRSVQLETLSVMEQAHTLSSADFVIAPHGAGLSNISFCNPGTIVIEIFGEYVVPCYWALSELCGLDYHAYFAAHDCKEREDNKPCERPLTMSQRRDLNIDLDILKFVDYVDQQLSSLPR